MSNEPNLYVTDKVSQTLSTLLAEETSKNIELERQIQYLVSEQKTVLHWCENLEECAHLGEFNHSHYDSWFIKQVKNTCTLATWDLKYDTLQRHAVTLLIGGVFGFLISYVMR